MISIYDYRDYKSYLRDRGMALGARSGFKSRLATVCGCNNAYISSILSGKAHFSLEQAERACGYLEFTSDEAHLFMLLVQRGRAGTPPLKSYFDKQIDQMLEQKLNVQKRLGSREQLSKRDQSRYYSSWIYSAIHVALSIPRLARSREAMAEYFHLPVSKVQKVLDDLVSYGLAVRSANTYSIGPRNIHLPKNSEHIHRHHTNWRVQAIKSFEKESEQDLNYSSAVTLSRADAFKVREIFLSAIKNSIDLIVDSAEEEVYAINLDFIQLGTGRS